MLTTDSKSGGRPIYKVTPARWEGEYVTIYRDDAPLADRAGDYYISVSSGAGTKGTYFTDEEFEELFLAYMHIRWENDNGES